MKKRFSLALIWLLGFLAGSSYGHYTQKGHVHTLSETQRRFLNPDCRSTGTCDLKRFTLTTSVYEVWFSDDPDHPTYGNGAIMEYETDSVAALSRYAVVQFVKGCVFHSSKDGNGKVLRHLNYVVPSFGESVPLCFPKWVIDSQDTDPVYNSDPEYGRFHLLRWNKPGSYDLRTQKYYGVQKPKRPVVYLTDYPAGAFVTKTGAKNVALEFKTCIYKSSDVPAKTQRDHINFAAPLSCFDWQSVYVYDFAKRIFHSDLAALPAWAEPSAPIVPYVLVILAVLFVALALLTFAHLDKSLRKPGRRGARASCQPWRRLV
jgi:hypothetical protein